MFEWGGDGDFEIIGEGNAKLVKGDSEVNDVVVRVFFLTLRIRRDGGYGEYEEAWLVVLGEGDGAREVFGGEGNVGVG